MKTNEEKLKQLLQIACKNGWTPNVMYKAIIADDCDEYEICNNCVCTSTFFTIGSVLKGVESLNDLVTNWEVGEVSFIDALCNYSEMGELYDTTGMHKQIIKGWLFDDKFNLRPTSERLEWLFKIFKHLFDEK
jgi:hypothetical protein